MIFYQQAPQFGHPYHDDKILQQLIKKYFPESYQSELEADLARFGQRVVDELELLAQEAERNEPMHIPYDAWGKRIDEIKVSDA